MSNTEFGAPPAYVGDKPLRSNPQPVPQEGEVAQYGWQLTFWMKITPNSAYETAPLSLEECDLIRDGIKAKKWFVAPMKSENGARICYDGDNVYAFQIKKTLIN